MSISRSALNRWVIFECDDCGEEFNAETDEFDDALLSMKDDGWRVRKEDGTGWCHYCPECA